MRFNTQSAVCTYVAVCFLMMAGLLLWDATLRAMVIWALASISGAFAVWAAYGYYERLSSFSSAIVSADRTKRVEERKQASVKRDKELFANLCLLTENSRCYLNADCKVEDLCAMLGCSRASLSYIISKFAGTNFRQFINNYRVKFAIDLIEKDPNMRLWSVSDLSGFASTNTFNSAFRKHTGKTPTEVREELLKKRAVGREPIARPSPDAFAPLS